MDAASRVTEQGYARSEAARRLDINANMLGRRVKEHQSDEGQAFRGSGKLTSSFDTFINACQQEGLP